MPSGTFFMDRDRQFMARALELATKGRGRTSPNPMVGCVVARNGEILGEGYHRRAGERHAEVEAVELAGDVSGATLYVTLEPCSHHGKTHPCVDLLREKKPARVVAAMEDPNPLVSGQGLDALRDAGIKTEVGLLGSEARRLNEVFVKYITTKTPFVIAKCGMSLDGKIATRTGDSKWVTGEASRRRVHEIRNEVDAILVGSRTVMTDDPRLTTRLEGIETKDPIRIILDGNRHLDSDRRVFHLESEAPTWVVSRGEDPVDGADEVLSMPGTEAGLDLNALMVELGRREITSVLIEGGGATHASAFAAGVVDKVLFFVAPKIVGGRNAVSAVEGEGVASMGDAIALYGMKAEAIGEDLMIEAYVGQGP